MKLPFLLAFLITFGLAHAAPLELLLSQEIYHNQEEPFLTYQGPGEYDNFMVMNVKYAPIQSLRSQLETALGIKLDYLKKMNPNGEAHVTVITPVEFDKILKLAPAKLTLQEINDIAQSYDIQESKLNILGMGSGKKIIDGKIEETYFVIVDSLELRNIRQQVYYKFLRRGGDAKAFDPTWFFPHITVGYTKRDLHEDDGIIKNIKHSYDQRFMLKMVP